MNYRNHYRNPPGGVWTWSSDNHWVFREIGDSEKARKKKHNIQETQARSWRENVEAQHRWMGDTQPKRYGRGWKRYGTVPCSSIFVDGIPRMMTVQSMWRLVGWEPEVVDIYISRKRRLVEKCMFAFIRVLSDQAAARLKKRLNVTSIMGSPLRAEDARQPKREGMQTDVERGRRKYITERKEGQQKVWVPKKKTEKKLKKKVWREKVTQPAKVMKEEQREVITEKDTADAEMEYKPKHKEDTMYEEARIDVQGQNFIVGSISEDNKEWLSRSMVGFTKVPTDPEIIWGRLLDWQMVIKVTPMGLYKFVVTCDCKETLEEALNSQVFDYVFEYAEPWTEEEVGETRRIWVECHGLPLHGWNEQNMRKIGGYVGHVVKIEDRAVQNQEYGSFKALVDTTFLCQVDHNIMLGLGGNLYQIHIKEYSGGIHWISGGGNFQKRREDKRNVEQDTSLSKSTTVGDSDIDEPMMEEVSGEKGGGARESDAADGGGRLGKKMESHGNDGILGVGPQLEQRINEHEEVSGDGSMWRRECGERQGDSIEIHNQWESGVVGVGIEETQDWTAQQLSTPVRTSLSGLNEGDMDLEAGTGFGPPPGFEAQHVKRTWSGGKLLRAAWAMWQSVTSYSAPARILNQTGHTKDYGLNVDMAQNQNMGENEIQIKTMHGPEQDFERDRCKEGARERVKQDDNKKIQSGPNILIEDLAAVVGERRKANVSGLTLQTGDKIRSCGSEQDSGQLPLSSTSAQSVENLDNTSNDSVDCNGAEQQRRRRSTNILPAKDDVREEKGCNVRVSDAGNIEEQIKNPTEQAESDDEQIARQEDEIEALKSLTVAFGLDIQPKSEDEFVENFIEKRAQARREQKEAQGNRVICTRSVTAKNKRLQ